MPRAAASPAWRPPAVGPPDAAGPAACPGPPPPRRRGPVGGGGELGVQPPHLALAILDRGHEEASGLASDAPGALAQPGLLPGEVSGCALHVERGTAKRQVGRQ